MRYIEKPVRYIDLSDSEDFANLVGIVARTIACESSGTFDPTDDEWDLASTIVTVIGCTYESGGTNE